MPEIRIPELAEISIKLDKSLQILNKLIEASPTVPKYDAGRLMTASEVKSLLRCGAKKLADLVEAGKVKKFDEFGARPRYQVVRYKEENLNV